MLTILFIMFMLYSAYIMLRIIGFMFFMVALGLGIICFGLMLPWLMFTPLFWISLGVIGTLIMLRRPASPKISA